MLGTSQQQELDRSEQDVGWWSVADPVDHPEKLGVGGNHLDQMVIERGTCGVETPVPQVLGSDFAHIRSRRYAVASESAYSFQR